MTTTSAVLLSSTLVLLGLHSVRFYGQQEPANATTAACGSTPANYSVKHDTTPFVLTPVPPGKALIYVIENMPPYPIVTSKVNIGLDGEWLGATDANSHIYFTIEPGLHHLCAVYQGRAAVMDAEGQTLLLRLNAEAGHTYYLRYHALFPKESPGLAFFEAVDEDEGLLLLERTEASTSAIKK